MKGGIVSMLYGAAAAKELGLLGDGRIVIHLVCDEETGSAVGSGYLREHNLIDPSALAMMTAEQSGEVIWNAAKGALSMRVDVLGRPIHVGQALKGVNSFLHMLRVAAPLEAYAQEMSQRHTRYPVGEGEALGTMVVVGGQSGGGSNFNVVPAQTYFTVDGRFNPEEDIDAELARITAIVNDTAKDAGADVSIQVTQVAPPADTSLSNKAAQVLGECVTDITGSPARYELCAGCLDTRWYSQLGIPAFGFGPGTLEVSHGPKRVRRRSPPCVVSPPSTPSSPPSCSTVGRHETQAPRGQVWLNLTASLVPSPRLAGAPYAQRLRSWMNQPCASRRTAAGGSEYPGGSA